MTIFLSFLLSLAAWSFLALAMTRHRRQLGWPPAPVGRKRALQGIGAADLALSLWLAILGWDGVPGVIGWVAVLTAAAVIVVGMLAALPQKA